MDAPGHVRSRDARLDNTFVGLALNDSGTSVTKATMITIIVAPIAFSAVTRASTNRSAQDKRKTASKQGIR